jgi:polypeptide N-acetylgalactosaminyltransferase
VGIYCAVIYFSFFHNISDPESPSNNTDGRIENEVNEQSEVSDQAIRGSDHYASNKIASISQQNGPIGDRWLSESCSVYANDASHIDLSSTGIYVIIASRNEAMESLLLTILSVYKNTNSALKNIVIVDDSSDKFKYQSYLSDPRWESHPKMDVKLKGMIKIIRTKKKLGISGSKSYGVTYTRTSLMPNSARLDDQVFVFLDSHAVVSDNWLGPLVHTLRQFPEAIVYPSVDVLLPMSPGSSPAASLKIIRADNVVGAFDWSMRFKWEELKDAPSTQARIKVVGSKDSRLTSDSIVSSPAAPSILAVKASFYDKIGGFDPSIDLWSLDGLESVELSLRAWMCGGKVLRQPCSRVAHSASDNTPLLAPEPVSDGLTNAAVDSNVLRIAER